MKREHLKQDESEQINMLKQEYEHIPVPEEARQRMKAGIDRAKKEQRGVIIMKSFKKTGGAAVAAMLTITPVSYTHLDVYKRQELPWSGLHRTGSRISCR